MNPYKIFVANEEENKEIQDLFFELGCYWYGCDDDRAKVVLGSSYPYPRFIQNNEFGRLYYCESHHSGKEITLPELRDLVVLKRNDVGDATHENIVTGSKVLQLSNKNYYWQSEKWNEYPCGVDIKPITKSEAMKEYLNEKYELITAPESEAKEPHAKGWIEVPDKAEILTIGVSQRVFWKGDLSWNIDAHERKNWRSESSFQGYMEDHSKTVKVLWRRKEDTQQEGQPVSELIMNANDEVKLISCKEALIALANGEEVLWRTKTNAEVKSMLKDTPSLEVALSDNCNYRFWVKPKTITINGIEVPAPFKPKEGEECKAYYIDGGNDCGYDWMHSVNCTDKHIVWRTEGEIKKVVAAQHKIFGDVK